MCINVFTYMEKLSSVVIAVIEADLSTKDANINADSKVVRHKRRLGAILLQNHLAFEESSLRGSRVYYLWLCDHN